MSVIAQNGHAVVPTVVGFWGKRRFRSARP